MQILSDDQRRKWSVEVSLLDAPTLVNTLIDYCEKQRGKHKFARKQDIHPWDITDHMGRICILEIMNDPRDFIYRLDGTAVTASTTENLTGKSILDSRPNDFAASAFMDMDDTVAREEVILWQIFMRHEKRHYDYLRLIIPLSEDGNSLDYLLTYSHRVGDEKGRLPTAFGNDVPSNVYD